MLVVKARIGDIIKIGEFATFRITDKGGVWLGLQIQADRSIPIRRFDATDPERPQEVENIQLAPTSDLLRFGPPRRFAPGIVKPGPRKLKAG